MDDVLVQGPLKFHDASTGDQYCCLKNFLAYHIMLKHEGSADSITHVAFLAEGVGDNHLIALFMLLCGRHVSIREHNLNGIGRILRLDETDRQMLRDINVHQRTREGGRLARQCGCKIASTVRIAS